MIFLPESTAIPAAAIDYYYSNNRSSVATATLLAGSGAGCGRTVTHGRSGRSSTASMTVSILTE